MLKFKKIIFLLIWGTTCFIPINSYSQHALPKITNRLELDLKIQTTLILSSEILNGKVGQKLIAKNIDTTQFNDSVFFEDSFFYSACQIAKSVIDSLIINKQDSMNADSAHIRLFYALSFIDSIELHKKNFLREFFHEFKVLARLHGVSVAVVWFASEIIEISLIGVLAATGLGHFAALAPVVPVAFVNSGIAIHLKSVHHHRKLRKGYGSRTIKKQAGRIVKDTKKSYNVRNSKSYVYSFDSQNQSDSLCFVAINNNNMFVSIGSFLGLNHKKMYHRNLKKFIRRNGFKDSNTKQILNNKKINKNERTVLCLQYLNQTNLEAFNKVENKFTKSFSTHAIPTIDSSIFMTAKRWTYNAIVQDSISHLAKIFREIPNQMKVEEVLSLLESVIVPYWSEHMGKVGFKKFRKLVKGIAKTRYATLQQSDFYWNKEFSDLLIKNCEIE